MAKEQEIHQQAEDEFTDAIRAILDRADHAGVRRTTQLIELLMCAASVHVAMSPGWDDFCDWGADLYEKAEAHAATCPGAPGNTN